MDAELTIPTIVVRRRGPDGIDLTIGGRPLAMRADLALCLAARLGMAIGDESMDWPMVLAVNADVADDLGKLNVAVEAMAGGVLFGFGDEILSLGADVAAALAAALVGKFREIGHDRLRAVATVN